MKLFAGIVTALILVVASSVASAQTVVYETYSPVVSATVVAAPVLNGPVVTGPVVTGTPVVTGAPVVVEAWRPVVSNYRYNPPVSSPGFTDYTSNYGNYSTVTSYYAPAVTAYSPVVSETVTSYSPVATTTYSPVVSYSPVVTSYYTPVVVRPRYVAGQPVRNFFRSFGP